MQSYQKPLIIGVVSNLIAYGITQLPIIQGISKMNIVNSLDAILVTVMLIVVFSWLRRRDREKLVSNGGDVAVADLLDSFLPNGQLIGDPHLKHIYVYKDGRKIHIEPQAWSDLGYSESDVRALSRKSFRSIPADPKKQINKGSDWRSLIGDSRE